MRKIILFALAIVLSGCGSLPGFPLPSVGGGNVPQKPQLRSTEIVFESGIEASRAMTETLIPTGQMAMPLAPTSMPRP